MVAKDSRGFLKLDFIAISLGKTARKNDLSLWLKLLQCEKCANGLFLGTFNETTCIYNNYVCLFSFLNPLITIFEGISNQEL